MLRRIVDFSLENRPLVLIAAVLMVLGGGYALTQLPIDVQPDITNVQVQVLTKAPALGPVEMEQFVTYPIEAAMNGLPRLREIRSVSRYGLSAVTVVFDVKTPTSCSSAAAISPPSACVQSQTENFLAFVSLTTSRASSPSAAPRCTSRA